jgi:hypothetical protein
MDEAEVLKNNKKFSKSGEIKMLPAEGSYQGLRHTMPINRSPLRSLITREVAGQKPAEDESYIKEPFVKLQGTGLKGSNSPSATTTLEALQEVNRNIKISPPFVHRPNGRYLNNVLLLKE